MWLASFLTFVVIAGMYLLPTIVAAAAKHRNSSAIFAMNLLFGWTFIGWAITLIWALKKDRNTKTQ